MHTIARTFRRLAGLTLVALVGVLPSCATMGGGMRYVMDSPSVVADAGSV